METFVWPLQWSDLPEGFRAALKRLRSPEGETLVLRENFFIEHALPNFTLTPLSTKDQAAYAAPFRDAGDARLPTLVWPREVPLDGQPRDVASVMQEYAAWLAQSPVPKLFVNAEPGVFIRGAVRNFCRTLPNQQEITVRGAHFIQDDAPHEIGEALATWIKTLA